MFGIIDLSIYIIGTILIILLPGPNSIFVLTIAIKKNYRCGFLAALGIVVGDSILILLTVLGAATLLKATPVVFDVLRFLGAFYLGWIGISLIKYAINLLRGKIVSEQEKIEDYSPHPFKKALIISLLNPKAILFFLSFFLQFVDPKYPYPALSFFILSVILQFFSIVYLSCLIFFGRKVASYFRHNIKITALANGFVGAIFLSFAVKLAISSS